MFARCPSCNRSGAIVRLRAGYYCVECDPEMVLGEARERAWHKEYNDGRPYIPWAKRPHLPRGRYL